MDAESGSTIAQDEAMENETVIEAEVQLAALLMIRRLRNIFCVPIEPLECRRDILFDISTSDYGKDDVFVVIEPQAVQSEYNCFSIYNVGIPDRVSFRTKVESIKAKGLLAPASTAE